MEFKEERYMTFGEKLQRLRKEQNWTQEELAEKLMVSRQALSKWESGAAIPDTENVIQISRLFGVSIDYLLNDTYQKEEDVSPSNPKDPMHDVFKWSFSYFRILAGAYMVGISLLVLLILCILGSVLNPSYVEIPNGEEWVRMYDGVWGFLRVYHLEWLFVLCIVTSVIGILLIVWSKITKLYQTWRQKKSFKE